MKKINRFTKLKKQIIVREQATTSQDHGILGVASSVQSRCSDDRKSKKNTTRIKVSAEESPSSASTSKDYADKPKICISTLEKLKHFSPTKSSQRMDSELTMKYDEGVTTEPTRSIKLGEHSKDFMTDLGDSHSSNEDDGCDTAFDSISSKRSKSTRGKKAKDVSLSSSTPNYTPFELQYLEIRKKYPNCLLLVECGYKFRFFGKDAEIASKELDIGCFPCHNFPSASIPIQRLHVHVTRLVTKGYKVGLARQTETRALKAVGTTKNTLFSREVTSLYTKSTLIGEELESVSGIVAPESTALGGQRSRYLMCICESPAEKSKGKTTIGILALQPTVSSDVLYCNFEDDSLRLELENYLAIISPVELLLPTTLSESTMKLIKDFVMFSPSEDEKPRIEIVPDSSFDFSRALLLVSDFYKEDPPNKHNYANDLQSSQSVLETALSLPPPVIRCLAAAVTYLKEFKLERILAQSVCFTPLSSSSCHVKMNAATIRNLEIFNNLTNYKEEGSLGWCLDQTFTKFGKRLLHHWLSKPLANLREIHERQDVITEMIKLDAVILNNLQNLLIKLPDLERGVCSILQQKCGICEVYLTLAALDNVRKKLCDMQSSILLDIHTNRLKFLLTTTLELLEDVHKFLGNLNEKAAMSKDKSNLFIDATPYPALYKQRLNIKEAEDKLEKLKPSISCQLHLPAFSYVTVSGQEYLIEVQNSHLSLVPNNWLKISATKQLSRFRPPEVEKLFQELKQHREQLLLVSHDAWMTFLSDLGNNYYKYKKAVSYLAELDCYISLALFAKKEGYCRPTMIKEPPTIEIEEGRNPILECLWSGNGQYVSNSTSLNSQQKCQIITGPNMGGKSSYVRQVALIVLLAHIGSYIPARSARISIIDGIYTRMGAFDDIQHKKSTFMIEMQETAEILYRATANSLVVLDELGRGTSTHDGMAIAYATLKYFIEKIGCIMLFVTHYPQVTELEKLYPGVIVNQHMAFVIHESELQENCSELEDLPENSLTFLYHMEDGVAENSYGLNVARLAGLPPEVLSHARAKSHHTKLRIELARLKKEVFLKIWKADVQSIRENASLISW